MFGYEFESSGPKKRVVVYTLKSDSSIDIKIYEPAFSFTQDESVLINEAILALEATYPGVDQMVPLSSSNTSTPIPDEPTPESSSPGNTVTPSESINTTHDQDYNYKKVIREDGIVEYYFIGKRNEPKQRFPNWTEAIDDGNFGTIRKNAIIERVKFDSPPNTSPPESSQVSNIIDNTDDPSKDQIKGIVIDKKTFDAIEGANVTYKEYSAITDSNGEFILSLPSPAPTNNTPTLLQECINTNHDRAYNYKRLTYSDGLVEYYFIGLYGRFQQSFPNWTLAPPDTLVGKTSGTINRDAIVEKVVFDCPPVEFPTSSSLEGSIDTPPSPTDIPSNPSTQLKEITGEIQISDTDPNGKYNGRIRLVKNEVGEITTPPYQTRTDIEGKFTLSVPVDSLFIQAKKPNSTQTIVLPITQETNYVFDFSSITNDGIIQEQEEVTVTAKAKRLEVTANNYETYSLIPLKGDNSLKNDLGFIPLTSLKEDLDKEILNNAFLPHTQVKEITKPKKKLRWRVNQKLIDLLNKLKTILLPAILAMIAKFGISKIQELIQQGKNNAKDIASTSCPTPEELEKIIKRKNKLVKQLNNTLKVIETTLNLIGVTKTLINTILITANSIDIASLFAPTAIPGVTAGAVNKFGDLVNEFKKQAKVSQSYVNSLFAILSAIKDTLKQILQYLELLDSLIEHCYEGEDDLQQEQVSAELLALTKEEENQQSPVVTLVNGFTMGVETEITTNPLKRRRATATNSEGVVMLRGEYSFSSIDQILIDELVFYIQVNDLKAD